MQILSINVKEEQTFATTFLKEALWIIVGSILIGLSAQAKIPLEFSPIPITLQSLVILLIGRFYGSHRAALTVAGAFEVLAANGCLRIAVLFAASKEETKTRADCNSL